MQTKWLESFPPLFKTAAVAVPRDRTGKAGFYVDAAGDSYVISDGELTVIVEI